MKKKTTLLRELLVPGKLSFIMEAHSGLSARIVEEAGFKGIWASGLSLSAAQAKRDSNELSMTEVLTQWEYMCDAVEIPMLVDADTGGATFNEARILMQKMERIGVAGCCIEDKKYPKTNSFLSTENQDLANVQEHCLKIKAMCDVRKDPDFVIVARLESFILGTGLEDALDRAHRYVNAGADAILVHSKKNTATDIRDFMERWSVSEHREVPIVIVPTKYYSVPTEVFREMGISLVIWANHNLRASITAMQQVSKRIFEDQHLMNVEDSIATVSEIFRLQHDQELRNAEKKYLPGADESHNAIILAATKGSRFDSDLPKTLLSIGNKTILETQVGVLRDFGVSHVSVVGGYRYNDLKLPYIDSLFVNEKWAETGESCSLFRAIDRISKGTIISYGDIVYKRHVLYELMSEKEGDIVITADTNVDEKSEDPIAISDFENNVFDVSSTAKLVKFTDDLKDGKANFIGLLKINSEKGAQAIKSLRDKDDMTIGELINLAIDSYGVSVKVKLVTGSWINVESYADLINASKSVSL